MGHAEIDATAQACDRALAIAVVDVPGALPDHGHLRTVLAEFLLSQDYVSRLLDLTSLRGAQRRSNPLSLLFWLWIASLRSQ
jgi:hypothetical protein